MARPKEFERGEALDKALNAFWQKGFDGTSVADLLEATGLSRSSLYETFGDKEALFGEALAHYREQVRADATAIFETAPNVREGLRRFFSFKIERANCPTNPGGCLLTNTACAAPDENLNRAVTESSVAFEDGLYALLERDRVRGELAPETDSRQLARFFVAVTYGLNVLARVRPERGVLEDVAEAALTALDAKSA